MSKNLVGVRGQCSHFHTLTRYVTDNYERIMYTACWKKTTVTGYVFQLQHIAVLLYICCLLSHASCLTILLAMGISVEQWRAAIGSYNAGKSECSMAHSPSQVLVLLNNILSLLCFVVTTSLQSVMKAIMLLILLSGDVERNPGPDIMGEEAKLLYLPSPRRYLVGGRC